MAFPMASTTLYTNFEPRCSIGALPPEKHIKARKLTRNIGRLAGFRLPFNVGFFPSAFQCANSRRISIHRASHVVLHILPLRRVRERSTPKTTANCIIARETLHARAHSKPLQIQMHILCLEIFVRRAQVFSVELAFEPREISRSTAGPRSSSEIIGLDAKKMNKAPIIEIRLTTPRILSR